MPPHCCFQVVCSWQLTRHIYIHELRNFQTRIQIGTPGATDKAEVTEQHAGDTQSHSLKCRRKNIVVATRSGKQLTQDNADSGVQFITPAGPRESLLLAKDPTSLCENLICIRFPETSLNKGKRKIRSKLTHDSYALSLGR